MERKKPRVLNLCCKAGGASMGYVRAGFEVVGVDIEPQPNYPFEFCHADALTFPLDGFDVVHVSPPCQGYSPLTACHRGAQQKHPLLIAAFRDQFHASGVPYVIENVEGAKPHMQCPLLLCGEMFGLRTYRHRLFESPVPLQAPFHPAHRMPVAEPGAIARPGEYWSVAGHFGQKDRAQREALGIDWMHTQAEIANALPPAYTEWIGCHLVQWLGQRRQAIYVQMGTCGWGERACPLSARPSRTVRSRGVPPPYPSCHTRACSEIRDGTDVRPEAEVSPSCAEHSASCVPRVVTSPEVQSATSFPHRSGRMSTESRGRHLIESYDRTRQHCSGSAHTRTQHEPKTCGDVTQKEDIRLYCGIGEVRYHRHPVACGPYACISPVYGRDDREHVTECSRRNTVYVPEGVSVIQDSGAFSDGPRHRLSYADALQRQVEHARHYKYTAQVTHRASYDLLIDETWKDAFRQKERWSEEAGMRAVEATVEAAAYLDAHRSPGIGGILSAQRVTAAQYLDCTEKVLPYVDGDQDIFGLGGFCILGKRPSLLATFRETIQQVIPLLSAHGVKRVHIWGVCFPKALGELLWLCDRHHLHVSTDSVGPSTRPTMGEWGYGSWRDPSYRKPPIRDSCKVVNASSYKAPTCSPGTRCLGREQARHVALTREWLAHFREREPHQYRFVARPPYRQLSWGEGTS